MPMPMEHSARIMKPDMFDKESFKRMNDKFGDGIHAIMGKLKHPEDEKDSMMLQSVHFDKEKFTVAEAKQWLQEHKIEPISFEPAAENKKEEFSEDIKTHSWIKEIFAAGTWRSVNAGEVTITIKDLDDMVVAFNDLKDAHNVPLDYWRQVKVGHSDKQSFLKDEEMPAAGWIDELKRVGTKLVAKFTNIPKKINDLIETKAYRNVSGEIVSNYKDMITGKIYPTVLKSVALLGMSSPAIKGLGEFQKAYYNDENPSVFIIFSDDNKKESALRNAHEEAEQKKKQKFQEEQMEELEKIKAENAKIIAEKEAQVVKFEEEKKALETEIEQEKAEKGKLLNEQKKNQVAAFIESNSSEKTMRILPKDKILVDAILMNASDEVTLKFSEGDKEMTMSLASMIKKFIEGLPTMTEYFKEFTKDTKTADQSKTGTITNSAQLHSFAEEISKTEKISYVDALKKASKEHPELNMQEVK